MLNDMIKAYKVLLLSKCNNSLKKGFFHFNFNNLFHAVLKGFRMLHLIYINVMNFCGIYNIAAMCGTRRCLMNCYTKSDYCVFYNSIGKKTIYFNNLNGKIAVNNVIEDETLISEDSIKELDVLGFFSNDLNISKFTSTPRELRFEQLYLIVSEDCNMRCKYCRQKSNNAIDDMTNEEIKNSIDVFYKVSHNPQSVVFYGGEPLMNIVGIEFAINYIRSFDTNIKFSIVTNATLCDRNIANFLSKHNVDVIVSMDGAEKLHDKVRLSKEGSGTYQAASDGYHFLKDAGCTIGISCVIGPHNEKHFDDLISWVVDMQPNSVGFCLPHGDKNNFAMGISFSDVYQKMISAFEKLLQHQISLIQVERKLRDVIKGNLNPYECKACEKRLVACGNGQFGICEGAVTRKEMFFESLEQLTPIANEYQKTSPFKIKQCKRCVAFRICGGGCPYDKIMRFGRTDVPDIYRCGFIKLIVEYALKYILRNTSHFDNFDGIRLISNKEREFLLDTLNFTKDGFIPLNFNCEVNI